jgi:hypothetical protein
MPWFPGERSPTAEERVDLAHAILHFESETGETLANVTFRIVRAGAQDYVIARHVVGIAALEDGPGEDLFTHREDPDRWWVFNPEETGIEETEGWLPQAIFDDEGNIEIGQSPFVVDAENLRIPAIACGCGGFVQEGAFIHAEDCSLLARREAVARRERLPQGNSSVLDSVRNDPVPIIDIDPTGPPRTVRVTGTVRTRPDRLDPALVIPPLENSVRVSLRRPRPAGTVLPTLENLHHLMEDRLMEDDTARGTRRVRRLEKEKEKVAQAPPPPKRKSVYDHLRENLEEMRSAREAPPPIDKKT